MLSLLCSLVFSMGPCKQTTEKFHIDIHQRKWILDPSEPIKSECPVSDEVLFYRSKLKTEIQKTAIQTFWETNSHQDVMKQFIVPYSYEEWVEFFYYDLKKEQFEKCFENGEKLPIVEYIYVRSAGGEGYFPTLISGELKPNTNNEVVVWVRSKCYYSEYPNDPKDQYEIKKKEQAKNKDYQKLGNYVFGLREIQYTPS
jgi:hypothetical protein